MVDSRAKGARAESDAASFLEKHTGILFKRVPLSGALHASHGLKGDLYIPNSSNKYCIEVKHYAEDNFSTKVLTDKDPILFTWWKQTIRESKEINRLPLLLFKHDRSKWFVGFNQEPGSLAYRWACVQDGEYKVFIAKLEDWIKYERPEFI